MILFLFLFWLGGIVYQIIEMLWCGHTHWSMFLAGGASLILIDGLFTAFYNSIPTVIIIIICGIGISCIEFLTGCIFNLKLKSNVWDYSELKGNILGQICPRFTAYWCMLSIPAIAFSQFIRSLFI